MREREAKAKASNETNLLDTDDTHYCMRALTTIPVVMYWLWKMWIRSNHNEFPLYLTVIVSSAVSLLLLQVMCVYTTFDDNIRHRGRQFYLFFLLIFDFSFIRSNRDETNNNKTNRLRIWFDLVYFWKQRQREMKIASKLQTLFRSQSNCGELPNEKPFGSVHIDFRP